MKMYKRNVESQNCKDILKGKYYSQYNINKI